MRKQRRSIESFFLALGLSFDHGDHGEVSEAPLAGKAPVTFEPVDLAADGVSSGFNPAMIALAGVGLRVREEAFDLGTQGRPVVFEGRQIVRPLSRIASAILVQQPMASVLNEILGSGHRCAEHDQQNLGQRVGHLPGLARVIKGGKMVEQTGRGHQRPPQFDT